MVITSPYLLPYLAVTVSLLLTSSPVVQAEDPYLFFTWNVSYGTRSPLGIPQRVILINNQFPGPNLKTTTNDNIVVNVFNQLDEPLLFTWNGVQQRKNSWYDGMPGTNCPIPPGQNFTYHFQVKDQIGSFYYYPTTNFQKAAGGFGGLRINSRPLIPVPFPDPEEDYTVLIGDWYARSHPALRNNLDVGKTIGKPSGVLINGRQGKPGDDSEEPMFNMMPGKTYRYRICNVGLKNTLNFRIQGHQMKLVEIEGSHVEQNYYDSLDVHLGQCYSVLVTADQQAIKDYFMVASTRFTKYALQTTARIRYAGSSGIASDNAGLPPAPTGWAFSLNQFRSFRWNLTASAARPNPQGSYHYGQINITRTVKLVNGVGSVDGRLRYGINGASHVDPETPLKLAQYFGVQDKVFAYDSIVTDDTTEGDEEGGNGKITKLAPVVINATFRQFVEIVFENHEKSIQFYHLSGYSFFPVAMEVGTWSPEKRKNYNLIDAVSRYSIQVYPKSWTAILLTFDNAGMWNLRSECLEKYYLGQQLYISVQSPERSLRDEYDIPSDALRCGIVNGLSRPPRP